MLTQRDLFHQAGGFDVGLSGALADVDLCLKIRRADYLIVYTPFAKLHWHATHDDKQDTSGGAILRQRWANILARDPYYNPNLSRERANFSLETT
jgi:GT2 family glycosyltransferase